MSKLAPAAKPPSRPGPRHQRPRLGGDGLLLLPAAVNVDGDDSLLVRVFRRSVDPFDHFDELLLAELFARVDVIDVRAMQRWSQLYGALDRGGFWSDPKSGAVERPPNPVRDSLADFALEQTRVRWLLDVLVVLSDHRLKRDWPSTTSVPALPDESPHEIGTDFPADPSHDNDATWLRVATLATELLGPYVAIAAQRTVRLLFRDTNSRKGGGVLEAVEWHQWRSILAPVSLQVFEALRRITEGEPGAARCNECQAPFLILDGRRRRFCNERHRHRYNQRVRRRRSGAMPSATAQDHADSAS
jgi:hypothetical protein